MSTTWDEASRCPNDEFTGKVINRRPLPRDQGGGEAVTLECPADRCEYHQTGWVVQIRPDNTIPDKVDPNTRQKQFKNTMTEKQKQQVRDALAQQYEDEQRPGTEIRNY